MLKVPYARMLRLARNKELAAIKHGGRWYMTKEMALLAKRCPAGVRSWEDRKFLMEVTSGEATGVD